MCAKRKKYFAVPFQTEQYWNLLRQHAELRLKLKLGASKRLSHERHPASLQAAQREVSVREIELEMQNDELRATQAALKTTGELYNRLYDQAPVGYISMDARGIIIQSNLTASDLLGTPPEMLIGLPFTRFILPDDQDIFHFLRQRLLDRDASCSAVLRMKKGVGDVFSAMVEAKLSQEHFGPGVVLLVLNDITERTMAAAQLHASEERFRGAFENSSLGMIMADMQGRWVTVNRALCEMLGYTGPEVLAMGYLKLTHPDDVANSVEFGRRLCNGEISSYRIEKRYLHKDGHAIWAILSATVVCGTSGLNRQYVGMVEDISVRKLALETLELSHQKLRQFIAHQERVKEGERIRIAREMHDELGSVLTGVKAHLSVALIHDQRNGGTLQPRLEDACTLLDTATAALRRVITELRPSVLDQLGVWAALEWHAEEVCTRAGLACRTHISPETARLEIDPERSTALFRILQEALTNVVRHAGATRVDVRVSHAYSSIRMEVEDNGKGMHCESLATANSWGVAGMRERAQHFGGDIRFMAVEHGTLLVVQLPIRGRA
ncbi:PAS domain S-box protein [Janthinobacterium rivuli]|uniref:PAS domain-containing sensor histidine kinase n=1 Tax=Janthinobacterium sp. FT68W TaxID=2654255 RepID=UPI00126576DD|nr:PAS domain S-box protein [Janthinobacterium sp. FT68W]KAB8048707.1 PAS domain S-box protein [Janthinobacterium sp. FT68W]